MNTPISLAYPKKTNNSQTPNKTFNNSVMLRISVSMYISVTQIKDKSSNHNLKRVDKTKILVENQQVVKNNYRLNESLLER